MISKKTAKKMYSYYTERIDQLIRAQKELTEGGIKSYTLGDRQITKFDLYRLSSEIEDAVNQQAYYDAIIHGRPTRGICTIVPNDK